MFISLGIENLPCELQRNFTLMRDLDNRTEGEHFLTQRLYGLNSSNNSVCTVYAHACFCSIMPS